MPEPEQLALFPLFQPAEPEPEPEPWPCRADDVLAYPEFSDRTTPQHRGD